MPPRPDTRDRSAATPGGLPPAEKAASGVVTERFVVTRRRSRAPWTVWLALGAAGAAGLAVCGGRVGALPVGARWWYVLPGGTVVDGVAFYGSLALLVVAWLGLGGEARRGRLGPGRAWAVLGAWGLPLVLGPPLFSRDLYSYVAQGLVAHGGHDPYTSSPSVLGPGPVLASVTAVWRSTPAPYGPLFVSAARGSAALFGASLTAEVVALRCLELAGVALVMVFLPRLARHHGVDPGVALWLGALSPLALLGCIASGHNDALMVGLVVAGVALVAEGRPGLGLVLCALAVAVKVPAAGAVVFVAVGSVRSVRGRARALALARAVVVPAATVGAVTAASGLGWGWLGPAALRVPTDVRVLQTPSVALGSVLGEVLSGVGVHVHRHAVVTVVQWTGVAVSVVVVLWLLAQVRRPDDVGLLGVALAAFVLLSPTVWPWYLLWGLVLLAATTAQRSRALALGAALAMLVVGPGGEPLLRGAGDVAVVAVVVAGGWWLVRRRRWATVVSGLH